MLGKFKEKKFALLTSFALLISLTALWYTPLSKKLLSEMDQWLYDLTLRHFTKPLKVDTPITVVDLDDKSLAAEGSWPWPRNKVAQLVEKLYKMGAVVIALDILFSEEEGNLITEISDELQVSGLSQQVLEELEKTKPLFDYDQQLADALKRGESVLSMVFSYFGKSHGRLPQPLMTLTAEEKQALQLPITSQYLSNIALIQEAAKSGGFINANLDGDGIIRSSALVLGYQEALYGSLALVAAATYLLEDNIKLVTARYADQLILEGIRFGKYTIPTDPKGNVLVPFRGPSYTFSYVSATDVLHDQVALDKVANRLIFIGSSAAGWKDIFATAIAPVYPGVEIHASIAAGILDHYFPSNPVWTQGLILVLIALFVTPLAIAFSLLGPIPSTVLFLASVAILLVAQFLLWIQAALFISMVAPISMLFILYLYQEFYGYFSEARRKKQLKDIFGQYVPSGHIDRMLQKKNSFDLEGENKELTVLFSDIRGFTALSEQLSATQIKSLLNEYLTAMTQIIFDHMGTIDKYVGDMIMAFWGAPLADEKHALRAVETALAMQNKLTELNVFFKKQKNLEVHIGIGINTGMMNVGDMGSKFRRAYTVLGDAVNMASRMESITKLYHVQIIVAQPTVDLTQHIFVYRLLDKVHLKGKEQATPIYEAVCNKDSLTQTMQQEINTHHQALEKLWKQEWAQAEQLFKQLISHYPHNKQLYDLYLVRIEEYKKTPPEEGWDGVYTLRTK